MESLGTAVVPVAARCSAGVVGWPRTGAMEGSLPRIGFMYSAIPLTLYSLLCTVWTELRVRPAYSLIRTPNGAYISVQTGTYSSTPLREKTTAVKLSRFRSREKQKRKLYLHEAIQGHRKLYPEEHAGSNYHK